MITKELLTFLIFCGLSITNIIGIVLSIVCFREARKYERLYNREQEVNNEYLKNKEVIE